MGGITIVGAGGIGCAVGYAFARSGASVRFVETSKAKISFGRQHGFGLEAQPLLAATFTPFDDWQIFDQDIIFLCVKCPSNAAVLARVPPTARVVPVQNGVDRLLERLGSHVEGIASFVSECPVDRPVTRITRRGKLHLGLNGTPNQALRSLLGELSQGLRAAPFGVRLVEDIRPYKYTKLMYNSAISPLAACAGVDNGELLARPELRDQFFALLRENYNILTHAGIRLGQIGPFSPKSVMSILSRPLLAWLLARIFQPTLRGTYCSMAHDLGRVPTEMPYYNGHLVELAGEYPCPLNRAILARVAQREFEIAQERQSA